DQVWPSQCSASGWSGRVGPSCWPPAQTSSGPAAATPERWSPPLPGLGDGTTDQVWPSQCSTRVPNLPSLPCWSPTAHTSEVDTAAAPYRRLRIEPGWGAFTRFHLVPSQDSIRACARYWAFMSAPTAQALPPVAATPKRVLKFGPPFGLGAAAHVVPL